MLKDQLRILLLGDPGVGRITLAFRFVYDVYVENYDPTIEESFRKQVTIDGETVLVELERCMWNEPYGSWSRNTANVHGFVLVYSTTSRESFEHITRYHDTIMRARMEDGGAFSLALFGNQCDLEYMRQVSKEEGQSLADALGCSFAEMSAKLDINVHHPFFNLIGEMVRAYKAKETKEKEEEEAQQEREIRERRQIRRRRIRRLSGCVVT